MALYGVRLLINIFDLCIYWRFLEVFWERGGLPWKLTSCFSQYAK